MFIQPSCPQPWLQSRLLAGSDHVLGSFHRLLDDFEVAILPARRISPGSFGGHERMNNRLCSGVTGFLPAAHSSRISSVAEVRPKQRNERRTVPATLNAFMDVFVITMMGWELCPLNDARIESRHPETG